MNSTFHYTYRLVRKIVVFVIGITVVIIGIVMFVTPGPAIVVIPAGLAILSLEFAWARRWLRKMKEKTKEVANKADNWRKDRKEE